MQKRAVWFAEPKLPAFINAKVSAGAVKDTRIGAGPFRAISRSRRSELQCPLFIQSVLSEPVSALSEPSLCQKISDIENSRVETPDKNKSRNASFSLKRLLDGPLTRGNHDGYFFIN
jgi:hypothetical protein